MAKKHKRGRGKCARNAVRGMIGANTENSKKKVFTGTYAIRQERRAEEAEKKRQARLARETAAGAVGKEANKVPHSFVIHSGQVGKYITRLERDIRKIMEPNTAHKLKILKRNNVKDFVVNGAVLGVTHMMVLTRSELSINLRIMRLTQGPTISFRVKEYCLARHVLSTQKRALVFPAQFTTAPLVVMSGFGDESKKHLQLVQTTFQNLFPAINVDVLNLSTVKRCLMVKYNAEDDTIDIRHYAIKTVPTGMSKSAKKLMQSKVPDLSKYKDISEYFLDPGQLSDSCFEGEQKEVELAQDLGKRGLKKGGSTQIRLIELGPRMTLELVKIEQGIDEGEVLYHKFVRKSNAEIMELKKKAPRLKKLRERRQRDTEHRVIRQLQKVADEKKAEEEEIKAIRAKAARRQAEVTGQSEDAEADREKDREIALQRERDTRKENGEDEKKIRRKRKPEEQQTQIVKKAKLAVPRQKLSKKREHKH